MTSPEEISAMTFDDIGQRIDAASENPISVEERVLLLKRMVELVEKMHNDILALEGK